MNLKEKKELSLVIIERAIEKYPKLFTACSFGKDSRVIADLVMQVSPHMQFYGIDTGYEFKETLSYAEQLIEETGMNFSWLKVPERKQKEIQKKYGESFVKDDQYMCCEMKLPAIESVLQEHDAWITGLRRDETESRKDIPIFEEGSIIKVNPIAFWTEDDVWNYIKENTLSHHPLYNEGYASLGCMPCTTERSTQKGGGRQGHFERAGLKCK